MTDIEQAIYDYIAETFDIDKGDPDFTPDVNLFDYGFVDSMGATEIILFIEEKWNIKITQRDLTLNSMNTVREISEVVQAKL